MNILIIGASRGLGLEWVRQYREAGVRVTATARDEAGLARLRALGATAIALDVADAASAASLAWQIDGAGFDVAIVNAGVFGPSKAAPEPPTLAEFDAVMHTNVLGPMWLLPQLEGALAPGAKVVLITSKLGSIGGRSASHGWLYRASKAAANSVMKDMALTWGDRVLCVAMHPGWVKTDMGGAGADLEVAEAVASMRATVAALTPAQSGGFFNHDGEALPW